jgi:hypothetical protein
VELPAVTLMTQEYVPAVNPLAYAETFIVPGVVPADGLTVIHDPPYTSAVKLSAPPLLLVTLMLFGDGADDPSV